MKRRLPLGSRLDRYVLAHFIASYASALGLLLGLFLVLDMASNLDDWLEPWADGSTVERGVIGRYYLMQLAQWPPCRFDVVAIDGESIEWLPAAFDAAG